MSDWLGPRSTRLLVVAAALAVVAGCENKSGGSAAADRGKLQFVASCATCHGPEGGGVKGLGKSLIVSSYVKQHSDDELVAMIDKGREGGDPLNTTGVTMPPKGGNAALTEADLRDVVSFLRTINKVD
jgi:disulfide bond formation protein DsbB